MDIEHPQTNSENEIDSLEGTSTVVEPSTNESDKPSSVQSSADSPVVKPEPGQVSTSPKVKQHRLKQLAGHFNIYLSIFILVIVIGVVVVVVAVLKNRKLSTAPSVNSQTLTQKQLEQLATSDVSVGDSKQILNVQSNAVFAGQVLVRQDLEVAGTIKAGGSLSLPGINVSGGSTFSQILTGTLTVSGNTAVQGKLTVSSGLNVAGSSTFSGTLSAAQVSINTLTLNGDLSIAHHINAGGPTPGRISGTALGSGGTVSVSGSDTAGSVSINTGSDPTAGCFITLNFATKFNATPHAVITPVGSAAGGLAFYVNRSTSSISICTNNAAPASTSFGYDYIVFD